MDGGEPYKMREPCRGCGCPHGSVTPVGFQDVVRCLDCKRFCYNAPRVETGRAPRTVQTVHAALKPKVRMRVIESANGRCEVCGKGPPQSTIHVGHIISVSQGLSTGLTETDLNDTENLVALCDECNLGMGKETIPLKLALRIFAIRLKREAEKE